MTYAVTTTPIGVSKTPNMYVAPELTVPALLAFDAVVALLQAACAADSALEGRWFDLALSPYAIEVDDAWRRAERALRDFRAEYPDATDCVIAASQMLLLLAEGCGDNAWLRVRSRKVRGAAVKCLYSFDPTLRQIARRLSDMADLMDLMITEAQVAERSANMWSLACASESNCPIAVVRDAVPA